MAEHCTEDVTLPIDTLMILAARPRAIIELQSVSGFDFDPTKGELGMLAELVHVTTNGTVLAREAVFVLHVLINALGRSPFTPHRPEK